MNARRLEPGLPTGARLRMGRAGERLWITLRQWLSQMG
jgi:hypothetical protein